VDDPKKFYEEEFESHFIKFTKDYYSKESSGFIAANSISDYMTKVEDAFFYRCPYLTGI